MIDLPAEDLLDNVWRLRRELTFDRAAVWRRIEQLDMDQRLELDAAVAESIADERRQMLDRLRHLQEEIGSCDLERRRLAYAYTH